jgi:uncharacterized surface protein with fasciclin (FAS1) repeats
MPQTNFKARLRALATAAIAAPVLALVPMGAQASTGSLQAWLQCRSATLTEFNGTIVDAAVATPELSTLVSLVQAANLAGPLSGKGPLTVFAPTNAAFAKVPAPLLGLIGSDVNLLTSVLTYHVNQSTAACKGVKTSNGTVWIIDSVLLPQFK